MNIFSRIINWYFSRNALPYWCILVIDYTIIILSGLLGYYLLRGGDALSQNFWGIIKELLFLLIPYTITFRLFHTYSGIFRYSSFVDLAHLTLAMVLGTVFSYVAYHVAYQLVPLEIETYFMKYPTLLLLVLLIAILFMCALRVVVKTMYDLFRRDGRWPRAFATKRPAVISLKASLAQMPTSKGNGCWEPPSMLTKEG